MNRPRSVLSLTLRWVKAWGLAGLVLGILMMLGKAPPIAEPGAGSGSIWSYWIWVPAFAIVGVIGGLAVGLVFAGLIRLAHSRPDAAIRAEPAGSGLGLEILVGAIAAFAVSLPILRNFPAALALAGLGAVSAWVMAWRDRRQRGAE